MATVSFRLSANRQPGVAPRQTAWARGGASVTAALLPSRRSVLTLVKAPPAWQPLRHGALVDRPVASAARTEGESTNGAGWFDSTWELQHGLDIAEGLPADLPLGDWLKIYVGV